MENMLNNSNNVNDNSGMMIAPFVSKTYQLVTNPLTDNVVGWGIHNNSFIILDPMFFSQRVLPAYFKHNNFSSFVRQLNTYGFRKVDPDRWEFANQWFLKGQEELLCNITRKKYSKNVTFKREHEMDEQELRGEVSRLKDEQRQLEEELHRMSRRIEAVERRPEQMMTLLYNVVKDPQLLISSTTMLDTVGNNKQLMLGEKKRRTVMSSGSSSSTPSSYNSTSMGMALSTSNKREQQEEDDIGAVGVISSSTNYEVACLDNNTSDSFCSFSAPASFDKSLAAAEVVDGGTHSPPPRQIPYPFSLLEGGF